MSLEVIFYADYGDEDGQSMSLSGNPDTVDEEIEHALSQIPWAKCYKFFSNGAEVDRNGHPVQHRD